jgi:hypothetical protein
MALRLDIGTWENVDLMFVDDCRCVTSLGDTQEELSVVSTSRLTFNRLPQNPSMIAIEIFQELTLQKRSLAIRLGTFGSQDRSGFRMKVSQSLAS